MLTGGSALAATAWLAPSVITTDRVAAATGSSCAAPPIQVDWSAYAGTFPTSVTANDGTVVTINVSDPLGVSDPSLHGSVFNGTTSTVDNPLLMAMDGANNGDYTQIVLRFSNPVNLCFDFIDVDLGVNVWEDTMQLRGTLSGTVVPITAADVVTGPANTFLSTNTIIGTASSSNTSTDGHVTVNYPSPINRLRIRHRDNSAWSDFQYIGIHDLRWC